MRFGWKWVRTNGRILAYVLLAVVIVYGLWRIEMLVREVDSVARENELRICEEQNELRASIILALEDTLLPPRPVPETASDDLQAFIAESDKRSEETMDRFQDIVGPLDCENKVRQVPNGLLR